MPFGNVISIKTVSNAIWYPTKFVVETGLDSYFFHHAYLNARLLCGVEMIEDLYILRFQYLGGLKVVSIPNLSRKFHPDKLTAKDNFLNGQNFDE